MASAQTEDGDAVDKFAGLAHHDGIAGVPLLDNSIARFQCRTVQRVEAGDHVIFICEVEQFDTYAGQPLVLAYEQATLTARYGAQYERYRTAVPAWLPRLHPWRALDGCAIGRRRRSRPSPGRPDGQRCASATGGRAVRPTTDIGRKVFRCSVGDRTL